MLMIKYHVCAQAHGQVVFPVVEVKVSIQECKNDSTTSKIPAFKICSKKKGIIS